MTTLEILKNIDFGTIHNYKLKSDGVFYTLSSSYQITRELCHITSILKELDIDYIVDEEYNIKVEIE